MNNDLHNLHKRKRIPQRFEEHLHSNFWIRTLDNVLLIIAIVAPAANISQIAKIYSLRNADGLSLTSWSLYSFFNVFWILYGFVHKEKPILISSFLWLITNLIVLYGILIY